MCVRRAPQYQLHRKAAQSRGMAPTPMGASEGQSVPTTPWLAVPVPLVPVPCGAVAGWELPQWRADRCVGRMTRCSWPRRHVRGPHCSQEQGLLEPQRDGARITVPVLSRSTSWEKSAATDMYVSHLTIHARHCAGGAGRTKMKWVQTAFGGNTVE